MKLRRETLAFSAALILSAAVGYVPSNYAQNQQPISPTGEPDPRVVHPDAPLPPIDTTAPADSSTAASPANARPPLPAARGVSSGYELAAADPTQAIPDTHTLAGVEPIGIGLMGNAHDYLDPAAIVSVLGDSRGIKPNGQTGLAFSQVLGAHIVFNRVWEHNQFTAAYNGGATIYDGGASNGTFQNVVLQQEIGLGRWTFHLLDDFLYSPQAAFGGNGMGGPGLIGEFSSMFGNSLQALDDAFIPGETIETGYARRYRNAALAEAAYAFSRRSAFTLSGAYGLLNFIDSGYISSQQALVQAGYDYELDPKNTIAVLANYGEIHYTGNPATTQDASVALAYGRKITGRLGFEVAAGPERIHQIGPRKADYGLWMASVRSALTYQRRRSGYSASYMRGLGNGAGIFFGARTNTVTFSVNHQFTRVWAVTVNSGYSFNDTIVPVPALETSFNHWYVGVSAGRQLNSRVRIDFNYGLQKQDPPKFCPVLNCGQVGYDHTFGVTANWHLHPILE